jgi:hypothetical protein
LARRCAGERIATIDMDATVIESWKREAKPTCEGGSGLRMDYGRRTLNGVRIGQTGFQAGRLNGQ